VEIRNKREMYALQRAGMLGNFLPIFTWEEFLKQRPKGMFGFRHRTAVGSPLFKRMMNEHQVEDYVRALLATNQIVESDVIISVDTSLTDEWRTLQGEVMRSIPSLGQDTGGLGLTLVYYKLFSDLTCRDEMRQTPLTELRGIRADRMLRYFLDANSYDWMRELMELYPDAVVEFTAFSRSLGSFGWNTLFWEVRNY
jgi:hypothetical protein